MPGLFGTAKCRHRTNASLNVCSIWSVSFTRIGMTAGFVSLTAFVTTGVLPAVT